MENFTPISSLIGGGLIGIAAAMVLLLLGRQAGASGIFGSLFTLSSWRDGWQPAFIAGLLVPPFALWILDPSRLTDIEITSNLLLLVAGGLLTGFGTQLGAGCTSGHGICGIGRFSARSILSVVIFLGVAMLVATGMASL